MGDVKWRERSVSDAKRPNSLQGTEAAAQTCSRHVHKHLAKSHTLRSDWSGSLLYREKDLDQGSFLSGISFSWYEKYL